MKGSLFMKKFSWKTLSLLLVCIAMTLITISDTGFQLLIMKYAGFSSSILRKFGLLLLFIKFAGTRYTKKEFFILLPLMILSLYNYQISGNIYCFYNVMIVACMKDMDYTKLFRCLFFSTFAAAVVIGLLSFLGIGDVVSLTEDFGSNGIETRYCFGLYHPNLWHQAVSRCIVFFALGYFEQLRFRGLLILFVINLAAFACSLSRTGLLAGSAFILLMILYKCKPKFMQSLFAKITVFSVALCAYGSYLLMLMDYLTFPGSLSKFFNRYFATGRVGQASLYIAKNPIRLFGTRFPDDGKVFDCGFLRMLSESGYLLGGIFLICLFVLLCQSLKNNWGHVTAAIILIILYSLYEVFPLTRAPYNIPVFYFGLLLYPHLKKQLQKIPDE